MRQITVGKIKQMAVENLLVRATITLGQGRKTYINLITECRVADEYVLGFLTYRRLSKDKHPGPFVLSRLSSDEGIIEVIKSWSQTTEYWLDAEEAVVVARGKSLGHSWVALDQAHPLILTELNRLAGELPYYCNLSNPPSMHLIHTFRDRLHGFLNKNETDIETAWLQSQSFLNIMNARS